MPGASSRRARSAVTAGSGKPSASPRRRPITFWWLPLAVRTTACLGVAALLAVVASLLMNGGFEDPDPQSKMLRLSDQDVDPETTNLTKTLLRQNQSDQRIGLYLWNKATTELSGYALNQVKLGLAHGQIAQPLSPLAKSLADDLDQQRVAYFTLWFIPDEGTSAGTGPLQLDRGVLAGVPV